MRRILAAAVSAVVAIPSFAWAEPGEKVRMGGEGQTLSGTVSRTVGTPSAASGATPVVNSAGGSAPAAPRPVVTRDKRGITYDYGHVGGSKMRYTFDPTRDYCQGSVGYVECFGPRPPRRRGGDGPAPVPPPLSPTEVVERTIVNVRLPQPDPTIDPGHAVTGLRAYLETGNRTNHTFAPIDTVLGPLSISATSTYTVDWGDGTVTGPHSSNGGAYPDGDITHVYQDARVVDVTVTQNWTAQWSLAGQSGAIGGLQSAGTIEDFEVREVQAVRRR